jgi:hypothetical protein
MRFFHSTWIQKNTCSKSAVPKVVPKGGPTRRSNLSYHNSLDATFQCSHFWTPCSWMQKSGGPIQWLLTIKNHLTPQLTSLHAEKASTSPLTYGSKSEDQRLFVKGEKTQQLTGPLRQSHEKVCNEHEEESHSPH